MNNDRLSNLALLNIERQFLQEALNEGLDDIINAFAGAVPGRGDFLF